MLVNVFHDSKSEHRRLLLAGFAFMIIIALLIGLSIAIYDKKFTTSTTVTMKAERAGLQLARFGDVRMHGALVGYVDEISSDGREAVVTLKLKPEAAKAVPGDVSAKIQPTTLFGQNFVELIPSEGATAAAIRDGDTIPSDRVETSVDLQNILADLFPLLRSIKPADLNATLYSLAHALQGKGEQLGDTLVELDEYLSTFNDELPALKTDLNLLSKVSESYDLAAPDLITVLRNATVTARTITRKEGDLKKALGSLTGLARTSRVTLKENEQRLIRQTRTGRPLLELLDTYSPELECVISGLERQIPNSENVFQNEIIHQTMELGAPQRTAYDVVEDAPVYGEVGHGPWCFGLPDNHEIPAPFAPIKDGSDKDDPDGGIGR